MRTLKDFENCTLGSNDGDVSRLKDLYFGDHAWATRYLIVGHHIHATDGEVGDVEGFLIDDETWAIRYLVVSTGNWWLGHKVLTASQWVGGVHWSDKTVSVDLDRAAVKSAPPTTRRPPWIHHARRVFALRTPCAVWLMVPAAAVDTLLEQLTPLLQSGDVVIDGGNSYHLDDLGSAARLVGSNIAHLDVGTSGGVARPDRGYCLMMGGSKKSVQHLAPVFATLAPGRGTAAPSLGRRTGSSNADQGWLHCGPHGARHFVKMVDNGIEYGAMAAYAEGLNILHNADVGLREHAVDAEATPLREPAHYQCEMDLPEIAEVWRRGSVIGSWLLDLTAAALAADPKLAGYEGRMSDSGEVRWTAQAAIDEAVSARVLSAALYDRFGSRGDADFANRALSAMRHDFGGHVERLVPGPSARS